MSKPPNWGPGLPTCIALDFTLRQDTQGSGIGNTTMTAVHNAIVRAYKQALRDHGLDGAHSVTLTSMKPKPFAAWFRRVYKREPTPSPLPVDQRPADEEA